MQLNLNVKFSIDGGAQALLNLILKGITTMSAQLDALTAQVQQNTTVIDSAMTLIAGLKTELDKAIAAQAGGDDGAALQALSASLAASDQALAAAVTANTPVAAPAGGDISVTGNDSGAPTGG